MLLIGVGVVVRGCDCETLQSNKRVMLAGLIFNEDGEQKATGTESAWSTG
jgi:hypothetical protein